MKLRLGCLLVLLVLIVPPIVAAQFLPWWGVVLFTIGEVMLLAIVGPKLAGWAFKRFLLGLMGMKSRVLRGAQVEVHDVRRSARPGGADRFIDDVAIVDGRTLPGLEEEFLATVDALLPRSVTREFVNLSEPVAADHTGVEFATIAAAVETFTV